MLNSANSFAGGLQLMAGAGDQPFGSMPALRNFSRQASLTHELKLPLPAAKSICSSRASSKRIFFLVLPARSKAALVFLSCIGTYQYYRLKPNGTYRVKNTQPLNTAKPGSGGTLTGPLTKPLNEVTVMAGSQHTQTHPKYQYRFMALSRADHSAKPLRLTIEATSEREARKALAPHYILSLAAVLPIQEVCHA